MQIAMGYLRVFVRFLLISHLICFNLYNPSAFVRKAAVVRTASTQVLITIASSEEK